MEDINNLSMAATQLEKIPRLEHSLSYIEGYLRKTKIK
jgi:hypothetical protein